MHGNGALALPFTDDDFSAGVDLRVDVSGFGFFIVSLPLPVAAAGLPFGYYSFGSSADDLAEAFAAALTAADPWEPWTAERGMDECRERYSLRRNTTTEFTLTWTDAASTLPAEYFGWDSNADGLSIPDLSGSRVAFAPYAPGRAWFPPYTLWTRRDPERVTAHSLGYAGTVEKRRYSVGWKHLDLRHGPVVEARLFKSAVEDFDLNAMVPGLSTSDPNYPLESLWDHAATRSPFRYTWDWENSPDDYYSLEVRDNEWLTRFSDPLSLLPETSPPQWEVTLPMIDYKETGSDFDLASVVCDSGGAVVELTTLAEGLAQSEGTRVRMTQTADPANNIPEIIFETTIVSGGWGPAGAAVGFRDLPSGRWAWGNIDDQVGAPGSTDRLLVYRSASAAPVTFNANKTITLTWTSGEATTGYFNTLAFVGIEVNIPIPRIEGSDIVIDNFPNTVGTSTLWQTFCGICNPTSIDKSIMSNLAAGAGVGGGFGQFNQAVASGALLANATVATNPTYAGIPVRLQTQIAQSRVADDGWVVSFIPQAPETPYDGVQAVSPPGVQTDWIANDWVTFLAITNQTSADSWSVDSQTVLIPEPHFYNFAGGVPT